MDISGLYQLSAIKFSYLNVNSDFTYSSCEYECLFPGEFE